MSTTNQYLLTTENLAIGYANKKGDLRLATNLNLQLAKGKMVCLLGKNGIGKSTLLKTLQKVQMPLEGEIYVQNENIAHVTTINLAKIISTVFTERIPTNNLSVYELIALGRQPYTNWLGQIEKEDKLCIDQAIAHTHVEALLNKKHYELSDGQLQKVMIARALAQNTPIILLDEPTAHLDIHSKMELFLMLKKMANELNKSILISTHEIQNAIQLADELWIMDKKGIVCGNTEEIIKGDFLEKTFGSNLIKFDYHLEQFVFKGD